MDVTDPDTLAAELAVQLRLVLPFERQLSRGLAPALIAQARAGAEAAEAFPGDERHLAEAVAAAGLPVATIAGHLGRVALAFGDHAVRSLAPGKAAGDATPPSFRDFARRWAEDHAAALVAAIDRTTLDRIRAAVVEALTDREGQGPLAKRIATMVNGIGNLTTRARAAAIARTEAHGAASFGTDEAARATGLAYTRIWVSAGDARVRADHAAANGQRRGPNDNFQIGGHSMPRPGVGPASQTANCRCVLRVEPDDFRRRAGPTG